MSAEPASTCDRCGCTEDDCSQCIEATGEPCRWVRMGLCSRCAKSALSPLGSGNVTPTFDPQRAPTNMLINLCWSLSPDEKIRASFSAVQRIMESAGESQKQIQMALLDNLISGLRHGNWPTVSD